MIMINDKAIYESPEVKVVDILAEGVLCSSIENWEEGNDYSEGWDIV